MEISFFGLQHIGSYNQKLLKMPYFQDAEDATPCQTLWKLETATVGEISIGHINILSSKCISNEPIQVKFAPDFGINSNNPDTKSKH